MGPTLILSAPDGPHVGPMHYSDVIIGPMASQITGVSMVCSTVCSGADQRKHQSSASLAFVRGIYRWPVNSPHKGPVTRETFLFHVVIIEAYYQGRYHISLYCSIMLYPITINATCLPYSLFGTTTTIMNQLCIPSHPFTAINCWDRHFKRDCQLGVLKQ